MGLILGIDLCDAYSQVSCFLPEQKDASPLLLGEDESTCLISTVLCKKKGADEWFIGAEAYKMALMGEGTMVDKLVNLLRRDGGATMEGTYYGASELLAHYLNRLLLLVTERFGDSEVEMLAVSMRQLETDLLNRLDAVITQLGIPSERVRFLSHTECFAYYVASRPRDVWPNIVSAYDFTDAGLDYFEMRMLTGRKPPILEARREHLDEGFDLDILDSPMGQRMADTILSACAERTLQKKLVSAVFLTGECFTSVDWAPEFIKKLCNKRRVFSGQHLFSDGAAYIAYDRARGGNVFPYMCICEGRLSSTVSLYAVRDGKNEQLILAAAGSNWYESRSSLEFILDDVHNLELQLTPFSTQRVETINISLDELPARPNKTTRIALDVAFTSENRVSVQVTDLGFGELFPSTGKTIRKDFLIS